MFEKGRHENHSAMMEVYSKQMQWINMMLQDNRGGGENSAAIDSRSSLLVNMFLLPPYTCTSKPLLICVTQKFQLPFYELFRDFEIPLFTFNEYMFVD